VLIFLLAARLICWGRFICIQTDPAGSK